MIPRFDRYVDTRQKRYHVMIILTILACVALLIPYIVVGYALLQVHTYDSLFGLLDKNFLQQAYLARIVMDAISIASLSVGKILVSLIKNIHILEIICLIFLWLSFSIYKKKRTTYMFLTLLLVQVIACCILVYLGVGSSSLSQAIIFINILGGVLFLSNLLILLGMLRLLYVQGRAYQGSLEYDVEEIKEHTV